MLTKIRNGAPIVAAGLIVLIVEKVKKYWPSFVAGVCVGIVLFWHRP